MRILPLAALAALAALLLAVPAAAAVTNRYEGEKASFKITRDGSSVKSFRFVNRCPSDSAKGTLVPATMKISATKRTFSYTDDELSVKGKFGVNQATGTASIQTGDCRSGTIRWQATLVRR